MDKSDFVTTRVLHDFTGRLEKLGIDYMLTGSMAMISYSIFRQTADIDIVLELLPADADRIIGEFEADYYVPVNTVRDSINPGGMFNLIHQGTAFKVDCIVKKKDAFQDMSFKRRLRTDYYGGEIWIISKEDLILSKLIWAKETRSEMQLRDIVNLMRSGFDRVYVQNFVTRLGLLELYDQCERNAIL